MSRHDYDCPHCGATDSTRCGFKISIYGTVVKSQQSDARNVGCRVMHYTDKVAKLRRPLR